MHAQPADITLTPPKLDENAPSVAALRLLEKLVDEALADGSLRIYAETDMRVVQELQNTLAHDSCDENALKWLRQLALSWSSKLRGVHSRKFRRVFELIEVAMRIQRPASAA